MDAIVTTPEPFSGADLAADVSPLGHALGSPAGLASFCDLADLVGSPRPDSISALRDFVGRFHERLLKPVELPAIRDAYFHVERGEVRGLIALDCGLAKRYGHSAFSEASRHVGRIQLRRLRPMRDRTVQRYLAAVEAGEATGWHVVVYALLLGAFSMPLRQGLVHYAIRTELSLLESAACGMRVSAREMEALSEECLPPIESAVAGTLPAFSPILA